MPTGPSWTVLASLALSAGSVLGLANSAGTETGRPMPVTATVRTASAPVTADPAPGATCTKPQPRTAKQWQATFTALHGQWEGADVGSTVALPDGRTLWLFGDTLHRTEDGLASRHNSMLMGERGCLTPVPGPGGAEPLPTRGDGQWYWPTHGLVDGGRLFVFASTVTATGKGAMDFTGTGTNIAEFDLPAGKDPVLRAIHPTPSTGAPETEPQWGAAVLQRGGYTYIYGTQKVARELVFGRNVYVARVPAGALTDLARWQYWTGKDWSGSPSSAGVVIKAEAGVPTSFSVQDGPSGSVLAIAKKDDYLGSRIVSLSAPSPAGPWGSEDLQAFARSDLSTGQITYLALGHPDLPLASGGRLVSVSRNNLNPDVIENDPQRYRPQFFDVAVR